MTTKALIIEKNPEPKKPQKKQRMRLSFTRKWFAAPYMLFLLIFVVFPAVILVFKAFTVEVAGASQFSFDNFVRFFTNWDFVWNFLRSIFLALVSTLLCLLIAYPVAYFLAHKKIFKNSYFVVLLFVLPMWINFVLRIVALRDILETLHIPLGWGTVVLGMVFDFLPFMILPIYNSLSKMDKSYIEASSDLGANPVQVFFKTVIPLSLPGMMSGITMVFVPVMSAYAVSDTMSGRKLYFFGNLISGNLSDTNFASALSIIMAIFVVGCLLLASRYERYNRTAGGTVV